MIALFCCNFAEEEAMKVSKRKFLLASAALALTAGCFGPASAQDKPVVIYTAHISSIVDQMVPIFEKETGLKAEVIRMGGGDVIKRVSAEAGKPAADVIWSSAGDQLTAIANVLEPYKPADFDKINPEFVVNDAWTPYTGVLHVLIVNTKMVKPEDAPANWAELSDPKWKGKVASARSDNSGSAFQQMQIVLSKFGADGWKKYTELAKNLVFTDSSGAAPRFVADGETPLGLTLEDSALNYVNGGAPMVIKYLEDGTAITPDGVALVKGGPNPEGGKKFLDWVMSKSTQETLVGVIGRRSLRVDVAPPKGAPRVEDLNLVQVKSIEELGGSELLMKEWRTATGL
jgi:iron(III) transport system substrate-binding protein